ncbi:MAG TPA: sigma 54-interacting transcriptional regulator [Polyangiaceae bacterium]|jgi:DNA-binding NtrC family response regulator|nr:sigma 54-interacting transcriptional regulator [Polyangiaceae bacterium]
MAFEPPNSERTAQTIECPRVVARGPWRIDVGSEHEPTSIVLRIGEELTLGSGRAATVRLEDGAVSSLHCRLKALDSGIAVEDLASKNGLYVGGARVANALLAEQSAAFVIGRSAVSIRVIECDEDEPSSEPLPGVIGTSAPMLRVARLVRRHAKSRVPILLQGESGTGKDMVARAVHELGRRNGPYVPLNMAALPESLADAELFGHRRGAFTGAIASRVGAFEQAHQGTLFLDEIAELPLSIQVKLLRVVEDGMVRAVGATQVTRVDVRLVSASWAVLDERVLEGRFRADLYHRLSTVVVELPPLRQRRSDIAQLSHSLLRRMRADLGERVLSSAALARLVEQNFPGNVRELGAILYRAAASAEYEISAQHVDEASQRAAARERKPAADAHALLEYCAGNVSKAARAAGVPRSTFRAWLSKPRSSITTE